MMQSVHITRVLRYFGHLLRRKNATGWANGKRESASIRQVGRRLVDPFAQDGQISIERPIVERTQFDLHQTSILRDRAGKLKKRQQPPLGGLCIGWWKIIITHPHCQIRHRHFTHGHDLILPVIQFIHGFLLGFQFF